MHASGLSLFEPLQVDVSTPSTNTVILTPSKITIEHSNDYESGRDKKPSANGRNQVKRNRYVSSPIQWSYAHNQNQNDVNGSNDRTDFIEIVSEPEELCRSHSAMGQANASKSANARVNNGYDTPKKHTQCDDSNAFSIWEMAKENNEQTIIFHHKSDVGDKCCDNYCPRTESDTDMEMNADRSSTTKITDEENTLKGNQKCCTSMSSLAQLEQLNNSMPSSANASANNNPVALANFQKNNISQTGAHRFLDLSSDIRRYSKITNFEQQNASNLLPNYLSRSSNANLNEPPTATSFELFNIPSTSMYDKSFGSINLTTQNHFDTQTSSGE